MEKIRKICLDSMENILAETREFHGLSNEDFLNNDIDDLEPNTAFDRGMYRAYEMLLADINK